jgi:ATP-dependent Zn protease
VGRLPLRPDDTPASWIGKNLFFDHDCGRDAAAGSVAAHTSTTKMLGMETDDREIDLAQDTNLLTAYHEAGHAIVALMLGRDVHRVSIIPKQTRLGQCQLKKGGHKASDDWLETEVLILLAGAAAEGRISGQYCWNGASRDLRQAQALIQSRAGSVHQAERLQRRWLDKVEHLLNSQESWLAVEMVAHDLVQRKTISGRSARYHYEQATARIAKQSKR